jgi:hypothetical protein
METIKCEAEYIVCRMNFPRTKKCTNKAICEFEGKHYCGIHDPKRKRKQQDENDLKKEQTRKTKANLNIAYLALKQMNHFV